MAIDGLCRDLGHHIEVYRKMAKITMADWTCTFNNCVCPVEGKGLLKSHTHKGSMPMAWVVVQKGLRVAKLELIQTDKSYYRSGDISINHAMNILRGSCQNVKMCGLSQSIKSQGLHNLADIGEWREDERQVKFHPRDDSPSKKQALPKAKEHWQLLKAIAEKWSIREMAQGPRELTKPRERRKAEMESWVKSM